ncbi:MAG: hypothetical protein KAU26_10445 [Methylococcales bacterium]|nr:hypothetical protein [Methylococcales bacterium]
MMTQMKKSAIALAVASAFWGATAVADNNATATATVSGEVIASLTVTNAADLVLPAVVLPDSGEATFVTLACADDGTKTIAYDALGGNPYAHGTASATASDIASVNALANLGVPAGACADFNVTGQDGYSFVATSSITTATAGTGVELTALVCNTTGILASSAGKVFCGVTATVADGTTATGTFSDGVIEVVVVYD